MQLPTTALLTILLAGLGCSGETGMVAHTPVMSMAPLIDAGMVAVGDRETVSLQILNTGMAPLVISDITLDVDDGTFVMLDWWNDSDDRTLTIDAGSENSPTLALIQASFRPLTEGDFRDVITVYSNDPALSTDTGSDEGYWKVAIRGISRYPCAQIYPILIDYGNQSSGGYFSRELSIKNCGQVALTISSWNFTNTGIGTGTFYSSTPSPLYVVPGKVGELDLGWIPGPEVADLPVPESSTMSLTINDPDLTTAVTTIGNDCAQSVDATWDKDGDGFTFCGGDCNDRDSNVNPSIPEIVNKTVDDNCDGNIDEAVSDAAIDDDGDGFAESEGDCWDANPDVYPGAIEVLNGYDANCDGRVGEGTDAFDNDGDGFAAREGDCDPASALTYPGATETTDGQDNDCDGIVDEGSRDVDDDQDGTTENEGDCNDGSPWAWLGAPEDCDGQDNNCDGEVDEGDACAYLVTRDEDTATDPSTTTGKGKGCATVPFAGGALFLGLVPLWLRRKRRAA